jgi:hypothetical protein
MKDLRKVVVSLCFFSSMNPLAMRKAVSFCPDPPCEADAQQSGILHVEPDLTEVVKYGDYHLSWSACEP